MSKKALVLIILAIALLAMTAFFLARDRSVQNQPPTPAPTREQTPPQPQPQPQPPDNSAGSPSRQDDLPITVEGQGGLGCSDPVPAERVVVNEAGGGPPDSSEMPLMLRGADGEIRKYYLDVSGVSPDDRTRLDHLLKAGRNLNVRYVLCGSGGFRFVTMLQAAK